MTESRKSLTPIDQLALKAIIDHLEPHDCQWNLYGEAAQSVVDAVEVPIQIEAMRHWATELESYLDDRGETSARFTPQGLRRRADELEAELAAGTTAVRQTQADPWATDPQ